MICNIHTYVRFHRSDDVANQNPRNTVTTASHLYERRRFHTLFLRHLPVRKYSDAYLQQAYGRLNYRITHLFLTGLFTGRGLKTALCTISYCTLAHKGSWELPYGFIENTL